MNESKLEKLFAAARQENAPVPPPDFAGDVLRAVRRAPPFCARAPISVFEQLNQWFPRLVAAAAAIILLCLAAELVFSSAGMPEPDDNVTQLSSQLDLNGDEI